MTREATCVCGHLFEAADELAGGITNCPRCGKAVDVPGLRDPLWRLLQAMAAAIWAGATAFAFLEGGVVAGVATGAAVAALFWLVSRAL